MISPKIEEQEKLMIDRIEKSELDVDDKTQLIEQLKCSKEACNGMNPEQKIQALSENGFAVSVILSKIMMMIKERKPMTWKEVIVKVIDSWKFVIIVGMATFLLYFHPEIANLLTSFAK